MKRIEMVLGPKQCRPRDYRESLTCATAYCSGQSTSQSFLSNSRCATGPLDVDSFISQNLLLTFRPVGVSDQIPRKLLCRTTRSNNHGCVPSLVQPQSQESYKVSARITPRLQPLVLDVHST